MVDTRQGTKTPSPDLAVEGGFQCGMCKDLGIDREPFKNERALGAHKRMKHGVVGQSRTSQFRNQKKARAEAAGHLTGARQAAETLRTVTDDVEARIAGSPDIDGGHVTLIREMTKELHRLWQLEDEYVRAITVSETVRDAVADAATEFERRKALRLTRGEPGITNLADIRQRSFLDPENR